MFASRLKDSSFTSNQLDGIKYKHYGSRNSTLGSLMDQRIFQQNMINEQARLGEGSTVFVAWDDVANKPKENCYANFNGKTHFSANGKFKINDEFYLHKMAEIEEEHENALNKVMKYILLSDNICQQTVSGNQWDKIKGKCSPNMLKKLNPNSNEFWTMMVMLREIVGADLPILDGLTTNEQLKEDIQGTPPK